MVSKLISIGIDGQFETESCRNFLYKPFSEAGLYIGQ